MTRTRKLLENSAHHLDLGMRNIVIDPERTVTEMMQALLIQQKILAHLVDIAEISVVHK